MTCPSFLGGGISFVLTGFANARLVPEPNRWELVALQMAPAGRDKDRGVRIERIPVGHTRDVVRDGSLRAVALRDPLMLGRQKLGMLLEMLEQLPQDTLGFAVLAIGRPGEVDVLEPELSVW